jgi:hypothetical protein
LKRVAADYLLDRKGHVIRPAVEAPDSGHELPDQIDRRTQPKPCAESNHEGLIIIPVIIITDVMIHVGWSPMKEECVVHITHEGRFHIQGHPIAKPLRKNSRYRPAVILAEIVEPLERRLNVEPNPTGAPLPENVVAGEELYMSSVGAIKPHLGRRQQTVPKLKPDDRRRIEPEEILHQAAVALPTVKRSAEAMRETKGELASRHPQGGGQRDQVEVRLKRVQLEVIDLVGTALRRSDVGRSDDRQRPPHPAMPGTAEDAAQNPMPPGLTGDELDGHRSSVGRDRLANPEARNREAVLNVDRMDQQTDTFSDRHFDVGRLKRELRRRHLDHARLLDRGLVRTFRTSSRRPRSYQHRGQHQHCTLSYRRVTHLCGHRDVHLSVQVCRAARTSRFRPAQTLPTPSRGAELASR